MTLLLGPALRRAAGVAHIWNVGYLLADLRPALPEDRHDFLAAPLAAINDPTQAAALDRFPLWHDTPAVPLDAPWPEAGGSATDSGLRVRAAPKAAIAVPTGVNRRIRSFAPLSS